MHPLQGQIRARWGWATGCQPFAEPAIRAELLAGRGVLLVGSSKFAPLVPRIAAANMLGGRVVQPRRIEKEVKGLLSPCLRKSLGLAWLAGFLLFGQHSAEEVELFRGEFLGHGRT